jgi:hypothetical protein
MRVPFALDRLQQKLDCGNMKSVLLFSLAIRVYFKRERPLRAGRPALHSLHPSAEDSVLKLHGAISP